MPIALLVGIAQARKNTAVLAPEPAQPGWRTHLTVLGAYLLAALLLTWPLVARLGDATVESIDAGFMIWNLWAVAGSLAHGQSPFQTTLLYYPGGTDLYLHTNFPA